MHHRQINHPTSSQTPVNNHSTQHTTLLSASLQTQLKLSPPPLQALSKLRQAVQLHLSGIYSTLPLCKANKQSIPTSITSDHNLTEPRCREQQITSSTHMQRLMALPNLLVGSLFLSISSSHSLLSPPPPTLGSGCSSLSCLRGHPSGCTT